MIELIFLQSLYCYSIIPSCIIMYILWVKMMDKSKNATLDDYLLGLYPCILLSWMMPAFVIGAIIITLAISITKTKQDAATKS